MLPRMELKVENPDVQQEASSSFVLGSDSVPPQSKNIRNIHPIFSSSTSFERNFKHDSYRNGNNNTRASFTEYKNMTVSHEVAVDILNFTSNNAPARSEKPTLLDDPGDPLVDDHSKYRYGVQTPNKSPNSSDGKIYGLETESSQAFSPPNTMSNKISVSTEMDDNSESSSVTVETDVPSFYRITTLLNKNKSFLSVSNVTAKSNASELVSEETVDFTDLGFELTTTNDYSDYSDTLVSLAEGNTDSYVPVTEESVETLVPVIEDTTETVASNTEEIAETFLAVTEDNTETVVPVTEESSENVAPFTEESIETVVPTIEEKTYAFVPITDENTEFLLPIAVENADTVILITVENTETDVPIAEEKTETVIPVTESITDPAELFLEGNEEIFKLGTENFTGSIKDVTEAVLVADETTQTAELAVEDAIDEVSSDLQIAALDNLRIIGVKDRILSTNSTLESKLRMNSTETEKRNILLEASPRMEVLQSTVSASLEPTSFDVKIKTIKDLQVDAHDNIFDPSQIAKATSYEESSFSTATRSATVTTWVDPNNRNIIGQGYTNLTQLKGMSVNSRQNSPVGETASVIPKIINDLEYQSKLDIANSSPVTTSDISNQLHGTESTVFDIGHMYSDLKENYSRQEDNNTKHETGTDHVNSVVSENRTSQIPVLKLNVEDFGNVSGTNLNSGENNTEDSFIYEMPNLNRNSGLHLTSSVVIALSICCSVVVVLSILTVSLWLRRRHKNRSKIYLSQESIKPRAFFTKPMNPALLPNERLDVPDSLYVLEFQKPKAPVVLSDDPDRVNVDGQTIVESQTNGVENQAFVDIPLEDLKPQEYVAQCRNPPKFNSKSLPENDSDSGIKVWSSTGSLYTASPELCHCSAPPPPYLSSSGDEFVNLSIDALPSLSSKSRLLYV